MFQRFNFNLKYYCGGDNLGDLLDNMRIVYLAGAIIGIILIIVGLLSLIHYSISSNFGDIFFGIGFIAFGSMFLRKNTPAFIPIKQLSLSLIHI